jgi:hypothetical protein
VLAISAPKRSAQASLGTEKFTIPVSTIGLTTITFPPLRRTIIRVRIMRGWLLAGLPPIRNTQSACSMSSSFTVPAPVPITLARPTPLAWWQ